MADQPDHEQEPTERLPKTGVRIPVPKRKDVMAAIHKASKPEPEQDEDEQS